MREQIRTSGVRCDKEQERRRGGEVRAERKKPE